MVVRLFVCLQETVSIVSTVTSSPTNRLSSSTDSSTGPFEGPYVSQCKNSTLSLLQHLRSAFICLGLLVTSWVRLDLLESIGILLSLLGSSWVCPGLHESTWIKRAKWRICDVSSASMLVQRMPHVVVCRSRLTDRSTGWRRCRVHPFTSSSVHPFTGMPVNGDAHHYWQHASRFFITSSNRTTRHSRPVHLYS